MKKLFLTFGLGVWVCFAPGKVARAADCIPTYINALDQGWYDASGSHSSANDNYFCGDGVSSAPLRNWFAFNIPVMTQPIVSATLRVFTYAIVSPTGSETFELREVTTPVSTLRTGGSGLTNIYADLGDGARYASREIFTAQGQQFVTVPLNATFITNLMAASGGSIVLGGQLTSLDGTPLNNEYLFGSSGSGNATNPSVQLLLTYSNGNTLSIVQEPVSQAMLAGNTATFQVQVCGGGLPAYQWQRYGTNLPGANNSVLQIPNVVPAHSGPYRAVVTDGFTTVTSAVATLTVSNGIPPSGSIYIVGGQSPTLAGSYFYLCSSISGLPSPNFQWQHNGANLPGQLGNCLYLYDVQTNQSGSYRVVASNTAGIFTSAPISLVVTQAAPSGSIYLADGSTNPPAGSWVTLCSIISGGPTPSLQWRLNGTNLPGQTGSCLSLNNVQSNRSGSYRIVASNVMGVFTSAPIVLDVQYFAPTGYIYFHNGQPEFTASAGTSVSLYSTVWGGPVPSLYQWRLNGTNLPGQNNTFLHLSSVSSNQAGLYQLFASNTMAGFTSAAVSLTVTYQAPTGSVFLTAGSLPAPAGSHVGFCASISGAPAPTLQWQRNGTNLFGQTSSCINLYNVSSNEAGLYRIVANNSLGSFTSAPINLAINYFAPTGSIYFNSGQSPAPAGSSVSFCSAMVGAPAATVHQWQFNGTNLPGQTNACLYLSNLSSNQAGSYRLIAGNSIGFGTSAPIALAVSYFPPTATIYLNGGSSPILVGNSLTLYAAVDGGPPPSIQWRFQGTNLPGETGNYLYFYNMQTNQSGPYTVVASNSMGVVTSAVAIVSVVEPQPVIAYLVNGLSPLQIGGYYYLYASVYLAEPVTLQWRIDGVDVPDATNSYFFLFPLQPDMAGDYTVVATTTNSLSYTSPPLAIATYYAPPVSGTPTFNLGSPAALVGEDIGLYASHGGSPAGIQWRFNGTNLVGQTNYTLSLLGISTNQAGEYSFTAVNPAGAITSSVVMITVGYQAPVMQTHPFNQVVVEGATARFSAYARGGPPPEYFLDREGVNVAAPFTFEGCCGGSSGGFSLLDTTFLDAGNYRIVASNYLGMATSSVAVLTVTPAGPLDRWTQRNPLPQSQPLLHVAHGTNLFVAVGEHGTILTSPSGTNWTLQNRRADQPLYGAAYGNGVFVAVGDGGTILSSTDGTNWSYRYSAAGTRLNAATFGNGAFVVVGSAPGLSTLIMHSSDGTNWQRIPFNGPDAQQCVTFGDGRFIAAGYSAIITSTDGTNWSLARNVNKVVESLAYGAGVYVAVGDDGSMLNSIDGSSWVSLTPLITRRLTGVTYGAGRFVAAGARGNMLTSINGTNWSTVTSGTPDRLETIDYSDGTFISAGENGTIISSTNGTSWAKQSIGVTRDFDGMFVANGTIIIVGKGGSIITSTDGEHYTTRTSGVTNDLHGVTWGGGLWVAVGEPGAIVTSSNGVNWINRTSGTTSSLKGVTYAEGQWIAVGTQGGIVRSTNGVDWTSTVTSPPYDLNDVAYGNGMFLIAGDGLYNQNGSVFKSSDGDSWSLVSFNPGKNLRGIIFVNGTFLFTGNDGYAYTTTGGLFFTVLYLPSGFNYYGNLRAATWAYGLWIVVGNYGGIFTSPDMTTWTRRASRTFENQHKVAMLDGKLVVIGNRGGVLQSGRFVAEVEPPVLVHGVGFNVPFKGVLKQPYRLQASGNFLNWTNLLTFTNLTEQGTFTDTNALGQPLRFYRLTEP